MQTTFAPDPLLFSRLFSFPRLYKGTVINDMNGHSGFPFVGRGGQEDTHPTPQPPPSLPENLAVTPYCFVLKMFILWFSCSFWPFGPNCPRRPHLGNPIIYQGVHHWSVCMLVYIERNRYIYVYIYIYIYIYPYYLTTSYQYPISYLARSS